MEVYPYIVNGYTLDGSEHTAQMRLHGRPGTDTWYEFRYTASTDSEFVAQLKQFLTDKGETDWSAYLMDGKVYLQYDNSESSEYYTSTITYATGLTLTSKITTDMPETQPDFWRKGRTRGRGIWHLVKAKQYFSKDQTNVSFNPSFDISSVPSYPVCWPAFAGTSQYQEDHCLWLRQQYCKDPANPKMEEWEKYIDDLTHVIPYPLGGHSQKWRDGRVLSDMIKDAEYQAADGTRRKLYQGVDWCASAFDGNGYMPSLTELIEACMNVVYGLPGVTRAESDPINRSLYAIGGKALDCSMGALLPSRQNNRYVWAVYGGGHVDVSSFFGSLPCIPFARIELPVE